MAHLGALKSYREVGTQALFWLGYFLFEWLNTGAYMDNFQQSFYGISLNIPC